eukprot:1146110-Pelagomonas_calceolata.AAC.2
MRYSEWAAEISAQNAILTANVNAWDIPQPHGPPHPVHHESACNMQHAVPVADKGIDKKRFRAHAQPMHKRSWRLAIPVIPCNAIATHLCHRLMVDDVIIGVTDIKPAHPSHQNQTNTPTHPSHADSTKSFQSSQLTRKSRTHTHPSQANSPMLLKSSQVISHRAKPYHSLDHVINEADGLGRPAAQGPSADAIHTHIVLAADLVGQHACVTLKGLCVCM